MCVFNICSRFYDIILLIVMGTGCQQFSFVSCFDTRGIWFYVLLVLNLSTHWKRDVVVVCLCFVKEKVN